MSSMANFQWELGELLSSLDFSTYVLYEHWLPSHYKGPGRHVFCLLVFVEDGEERRERIYKFWISMNLNLFNHPTYYLVSKYHIWVKLLAYLIESLCLVGFVEPIGPTFTFSNLSQLVEIWLGCHFHHRLKKDNYLVKSLLVLRNLLKGFQKSGRAFIFLHPTNSSESLCPYEYS
jgi:hypothetical protein